jgi:hypothetical protein
MRCVIAQGAGYVVAAHKPDTSEEVSAVPIIDARAIPTASVVVFANYTELVAYGESGMKWRTKRLAWDGPPLRRTLHNSNHVTDAGSDDEWRYSTAAP